MSEAGFSTGRRRFLGAALAASGVAALDRRTGAQHARDDALPTDAVWRPQAWAPAPVDNPLKGLLPYASAGGRTLFPHSMEFAYLPLAAVQVGPERHDWTALDAFLDAVAGRGHQAVFRFFLEYPGRPSGVPAHLIDAGVKITPWRRGGGAAGAEVATPDYAHPALRAALGAFIAALGERYDGDPRIGFITAGLLGLWGEWHDHPRNELFANKALQRLVMDGYAAAFRRVPILLRYPAGAHDPVYAANAEAPFGYHDDSFAWSTLPTRPFHFLSKMWGAGTAAQRKWQTFPIGGEIRPEAWGKVFDAPPDDPAIEDFARCVAETHVSWLMDSGMFRPGNPSARRDRAIHEVRRMGYDLYVAEAAIGVRDDRVAIALRIENRGVAPFYLPWPLEYALLDESGHLAVESRSAETPVGILPGAGPAVRIHAIPIDGVPAGHYRVLARVVNPLPGGIPLRFANARQDADRAGWLTVDNVVL